MLKTKKTSLNLSNEISTLTKIYNTKVYTLNTVKIITIRAHILINLELFFLSKIIQTLFCPLDGSKNKILNFVMKKVFGCVFCFCDVTQHLREGLYLSFVR